jgi:hypothetical protein
MASASKASVFTASYPMIFTDSNYRCFNIKKAFFLVGEVCYHISKIVLIRFSNNSLIVKGV